MKKVEVCWALSSAVEVVLAAGGVEHINIEYDVEKP